MASFEYPSPMKKTTKYANLTLLGRSPKDLPTSPSQAELEIFPNEFRHRNFLVRLDCPDFTSVCPVTGQPDFGRILIEYIPDQSCIETKSLKLYLHSYRGEKAFNEEIANRILEDLVASCRPRCALVRGEFSSRGGISVTVEARTPDRGYSSFPQVKTVNSGRNRRGISSRKDP